MSQLILHPSVTFTTDVELVAALRAGDERAFAEVVATYGQLMQRVAEAHVRTPAIAEEVVQETWAIVFASIARFECRAALKTWIMRILVNRAKTRGEREARCMPFSSLCRGGDPAQEPRADADRLVSIDAPHRGARWACAYERRSEQPEQRLLAGEVRAHIRTALECLPVRQRTVVALRDVEGWTPEEVCVALGISAGNQRVLLHRARARMRSELARNDITPMAA